MGTTEIRVDGRAAGVPAGRRLARWVAVVPPSLRASVGPALVTLGVASLLGMAWAGRVAMTPGGEMLAGAFGGWASAVTAWQAWVGVVLGLVAWVAVLDVVHRLVRQDALPQVADRAVWLVALSPAAWWMLGNGWVLVGVGLLCGGALAARRGGFVLAGVLVAAGTVVFGPAVAGWAVLVAEVGRARGWRPWGWGWAAVGVAVPVLAVGGMVLWQGWGGGWSWAVVGGVLGMEAGGAALPEVVRGAMASGLGASGAGWAVGVLAVVAVWLLALGRVRGSVVVAGAVLVGVASWLGPGGWALALGAAGVLLVGGIAVRLEGRVGLERAVLAALALGWAVGGMVG